MCLVLVRSVCTKYMLRPVQAETSALNIAFVLPVVTQHRSRGFALNLDASQLFCRFKLRLERVQKNSLCSI